MNSTVIMTIAAACGSLVGAAASIVTTWITQARSGSTPRGKAKLRGREALYGDSSRRPAH